MPLIYTIKGFWRALEEDDEKTVAKYLARPDKAAWLSLTDDKGCSPLLRALEGAKLKTARQLVKAGARLDETGPTGESPLLLAIQSGEMYKYWGSYSAICSRRRALVADMIAAGADVNYSARPTPLRAAVSVDDEEMVRMLLKAGANPAAGGLLLRALQKENAGISRAVLEAGAPIGEKDSAGWQPLHHAAALGFVDIVTKILEGGADVDAHGASGKTALHRAAEAGRTEVVRLLLSRGARPDLEDDYHLTPASWARSKGFAPALGLLEDAEKRLRKECAPPEMQESRPHESWVRMDGGKVARIGYYAPLERKLTEIFNFESRQHIIISENLKTGAESISQPQSFDALPDDVLRGAVESFRQLGGILEDEAVFGGRLVKKGLKTQGGPS
jgi:ankyrin repeat protein